MRKELEKKHKENDTVIMWCFADSKAFTQMFGVVLSLYGWQALKNMAGQTTSVASLAQTKDDDSSDISVFACAGIAVLFPTEPDEFLRLKHFRMALDIVATEMVSTLFEAYAIPITCRQKQFICVQHVWKDRIWPR